MRSVEEHTAFGRLTEKQRSGIEIHRPSRRHVPGTPDLSKLSGEGLYPKTFFSRAIGRRAKALTRALSIRNRSRTGRAKTLPNWNRARTQTPQTPQTLFSDLTLLLTITSIESDYL
jgi:hypothetical protein